MKTCRVSLGYRVKMQVSEQENQTFQLCCFQDSNTHDLKERERGQREWYERIESIRDIVHFSHHLRALELEVQPWWLCHQRAVQRQKKRVARLLETIVPTIFPPTTTTTTNLHSFQARNLTEG